jgi:hypothetical protein
MRDTSITHCHSAGTSFQGNNCSLNIALGRIRPTPTSGDRSSGRNYLVSHFPRLMGNARVLHEDGCKTARRIRYRGIGHTPRSGVNQRCKDYFSRLCKSSGGNRSGLQSPRIADIRRIEWRCKKAAYLKKRQTAKAVPWQRDSAGIAAGTRRLIDVENIDGIIYARRRWDIKTRVACGRAAWRRTAA